MADVIEEKRKKNAKEPNERTSDSDDDYFIRDGQESDEDDANCFDNGMDDDDMIGEANGDEDSEEDSQEESVDMTSTKGRKCKGTPETLYIQMEYCPGDTLRTVVFI